MFGAVYVLLATAAAGVQFGWQPLDSGGREYIIQVEPQLIDTFRKEGFTSDVPPDLRDIRRIRIVVGSAPLPNQGAMAPARGAAGLATTAAKVPTGLAGDALPLPGPAETRDPPPVAPQPPAGDATKPPSLASDSPKANVSSRTAEKPSTDSPPPDPTPDPRAASNWPTPISVPPNDNSWPPRHAPTPDNATGPNGNRLAATDSFSGQRRSPSDELPSADAPRPWGVLLGVSALLIASLAGNAYLGWSYLGARNRYLDLVDDLHGQPHIIDSAKDDQAAEEAEEEPEEDETAPPKSAGKPARAPSPSGRGPG